MDQLNELEAEMAGEELDVEIGIGHIEGQNVNVPAQKNA